MYLSTNMLCLGFPSGSVVKNLPTNAGDRDSVPGSWRSHGGGNGHPLPCSCLKNPMDRGTWQAIVHGVVRSQTRLNTTHYVCKLLDKWIGKQAYWWVNAYVIKMKVCWWKNLIQIFVFLQLQAWASDMMWTWKLDGSLNASKHIGNITENVQL